jgi:hypothetical protein
LPPPGDDDNSSRSTPHMKRVGGDRVPHSFDFASRGTGSLAHELSCIERMSQ